MGVIPYVGLQFGLYEGMKRWSGLSQAQVPADTSHSGTRLLTLGGIGFLSGTLSKLLTMPFDVLKKRRQVDAFGWHASSYDSRYQKMTRSRAHSSMVVHLLEIVRNEGAWALFRGSVPSLVKAGPSSASTFFMYELCASLLRQQQQRRISESGGSV